MSLPANERRDLMRLTYVIVTVAAALSAFLLWREDTAPELRGAVWTIWGGGVLATVVAFWFGSSAGKGRALSDSEHGEDKETGHEQ